jgi:GT2 family glycosyltransferase
MKIGVVIPTVDLWAKFTKPCIDSVKSKHELYFVLIDNNSKDETYVEATKLITPTFHYKKNEENWGCAKSWNYGIKDCFVNHGCDYVSVLNNDVLLHPNAIDRLVERFEKKDENIAMVTCLNVRGECPFPSNIFALDDKEKEKTDESEHPDFSAFMVGKKCIDEVGWIDEGFSIGGAYWEDNSFDRRIKLARLKAITYPPALFYHYGSQTINRSAATKITGAMGYEINKKYYTIKWGGTPGDEKWEHPFDDVNNDYKTTFQDLSEEKQQDIRKQL